MAPARVWFHMCLGVPPPPTLQLARARTHIHAVVKRRELGTEAQRHQATHWRPVGRPRIVQVSLVQSLSFNQIGTYLFLIFPSGVSSTPRQPTAAPFIYFLCT